MEVVMEKDVFEMIDLIHVPGINREMAVAMQKWQKKVGRDYLDELEEKKKAHFEELFIKPPPLKEGSFFWFELQQFLTWQWRVVKLETRMDERLADHDAGRLHRYKFLPQEIIHHLAESPVMPEKVVTLEGFTGPVLRQEVDIQFVHYSDTHIFGVVKGFKIELVQWTRQLAFEIFSQHKDNYPAETENFIKGFFVGVVPSITIDQLKPVKKPKFKNNKLKIEIKKATAVQQPELDVQKPDKQPEDLNLQRLLELAQMEEISQLITYKLWQLKKGKCDRDVRNFELRKQVMKSLVQSEHYREVGKGNPGPPLHYFILTKFAFDDWAVTEIAPLLKVFESSTDIVPQCLINKLTDTPANKNILRRQSFDLDYPWFKKVDVHWMRYSSNCIIGALWDNIPQWNEMLNKQQDLLNGNVEPAPGEFYRLLFHYCHRNFSVMQHFFLNFVFYLFQKLDLLESKNHKLCIDMVHGVHLETV
jgi:hypothetical protein